MNYQTRKYVYEKIMEAVKRGNYSFLQHVHNCASFYKGLAEDINKLELSYEEARQERIDARSEYYNFQELEKKYRNEMLGLVPFKDVLPGQSFKMDDETFSETYKKIDLEGYAVDESYGSGDVIQVDPEKEVIIQ